MKKYLMTLLFALTLTGCSQGLPSEQSSNSLTIESSDQSTVDSKLGVITINALGPINKKTLAITIEPAFAPIGTITWSSNMSQIVVTKIGDGRTAEVYATTFLPKTSYATITVFESLSGLSATGKVYAWQMPQVINSPIAPYYYALNVNNLDASMRQLPASGTTFASIAVPYTTQYQMATLNLTYIGSFAPVIKYKGIHQGGSIQRTTATSGSVPSSPGESYTIASYNIYLFKGDPSQGNQPVYYDIYSPGIPEGPTTDWKTDKLLFSVAIKTQE